VPKVKARGVEITAGILVGEKYKTLQVRNPAVILK